MAVSVLVRFVCCVEIAVIFYLDLPGCSGDLHDMIDGFLDRHSGGRVRRNLKFVSYEDMMSAEYANEHRKKRSASREPGDQFDWRIQDVLSKHLGKDSANLQMFIDHWGVGDNEGRCLFIVLYYLMHHKFYDIDWRLYRKIPPNIPGYGRRYSTKYYREEVRGETVYGVEAHMVFTSGFPMPVVDNWPSELIEACTDSVHRCVREIAYVANQNDEFYLLLSKLEVEWPTRINEDINIQRRKFVYTETWRRERRFIDIGFQPWKDREAAFTFATVASYFMCFYTLQREGYLISLPFDPHCHRLMIYSMKGYAEVQFGCSELAFCPDPCWGESKYGYDTVLYEFEAGIRMAKPTNNPCWQMEGGNSNLCNLLNTFTQPVSFMDLQMGRLNFSCNCSTGNRYSMITRQCEDIDECEDTVLNTCDPEKFEICRNSIGSFHCSCRRGYTAESRDALCVRNEKINLYSRQDTYGYVEVFQEKEEYRAGDKFLKKTSRLGWLKQ